MPGPLTVRQKCCDGSEKRLSWKRTSPQIWQRWGGGRGMIAGALCELFEVMRLVQKISIGGSGRLAG
jgi:hypothetical protein